MTALDDATLDSAGALRDLRRAATRRGREALGAFAVEGQRAIRRGLDAGFRPRAVLSASDAAGPESEGLRARMQALGRPWFTVPSAELLAVAEGRNSGRFTALFELPEPRPASDLLELPEPRVTLLVLVDVVEPGNVGALLRTALASGADGVVLAGHAPDPFHPKAVRTSLGAVFKIPWARVESSRRLSADLEQSGFCTLAAVSRGGQSLDRAAWHSTRVALLVGNEARGLPADLYGVASARVSIDLSDRADSYCVNAAAAVCLYEIQRRRRAASGVPFETPGPSSSRGGSVRA